MQLFYTDIRKRHDVTSDETPVGFVGAQARSRGLQAGAQLYLESSPEGRQRRDEQANAGAVHAAVHTITAHQATRGRCKSSHN